MTERGGEDSLWERGEVRAASERRCREERAVGEWWGRG